jgi:lysophospholipase L1-like esterase
MKLLLTVAVCCLSFAMTNAHAATPNSPKSSLQSSTPSFARFDWRAKVGEKLNVVFFGGSLTWGTNASDPQLFSYRALIGQKLAVHYPRAHFTFWDAAIGGTNSQLGAFRLERDVLRHKPDLVFLDFTVNDNPYFVTPEYLASYEALVRRLIQTQVPVISVRFPVWEDFQPEGRSRLLDLEHEKIALHYRIPVADVVSWMRRRAVADRSLPDTWWTAATDKTHPEDSGYAAYSAAVWDAYLNAIKSSLPRVPTGMLHAKTYMNVARVRLSHLGPLPTGWKSSRPNRTPAWYDALMSRWLDDEVVATPGAAPIQLRFRAETLLIFGEATPESGRYQVRLDGRAVPVSDEADGIFNASSGGADGNIHHVRALATELDPVQEHVLEITPLLGSTQELRLESVCLAVSAKPCVIESQP